MARGWGWPVMAARAVATSWGAGFGVGGGGGSGVAGGGAGDARVEVESVPPRRHAVTVYRLPLTRAVVLICSSYHVVSAAGVGEPTGLVTRCAGLALWSMRPSLAGPYCQ